jgi:hypothetical protein
MEHKTIGTGRRLSLREMWGFASTRYTLAYIAGSLVTTISHGHPLGLWLVATYGFYLLAMADEKK